MEKWTREQAARWWAETPWPVGCNYVTSDAVNDIEMWMDAAFHPDLIDRELGFAEEIGFNTVRVFLSYTVWEHEREVFIANFERFLAIADAHGMRVLPVLFDDCAFDFGSDPVYGPQPAPVPGVHNSRWVPSPGFTVQDDPAALSACADYVKDIVGRYREDRRILAWDLYNEPGNTSRYNKCIPLLRLAFETARSCRPDQPLTSCIWLSDKDGPDINRYLEQESDVISTHIYGDPEEVIKKLDAFARAGRPIFVTEWLFRPYNCRVENVLPIFAERKVGCWQWGLVQGKTQTHLSWDTMNGGIPDADPREWQHDLIRADGTPYSAVEIAVYRRLTGK